MFLVNGQQAGRQPAPQQLHVHETTPAHHWQCQQEFIWMHEVVFWEKKINENLGNKTCFHCSTDSDKVYCVCSIMQKDQKQKEQPWRCIASHSIGSVAQREKPVINIVCSIHSIRKL